MLYGKTSGGQRRFSNLQSRTLCLEGALLGSVQSIERLDVVRVSRGPRTSMQENFMNTLRQRFILAAIFLGAAIFSAPAEAANESKKISDEVAKSGLLQFLSGGEGPNKKGHDALSDIFSELDGHLNALSSAFEEMETFDPLFADAENKTRRGKSSRVRMNLGTKGGGRVRTGAKRETRVLASATAESPEVDGELTPAQIARVMERHLPSLRNCYERALRRNRKLEGRIVIPFEILRTGRVSNLDLEDDELGSREVSRCIRRRAKHWRFPRPRGGSVFVAYPVMFSPAS